jgi:ribosome recycling factor
MKNRLSLSLIVTALLVTSTTVFASSYQDSVVKKEAKAFNNPSSVKTKSAKAKVAESIFREDYLAKVKSGSFKNEANEDETKRLNSVVNKIVKAHKSSLKNVQKEFMSGLNSTIMSLHAIKVGDSAKAQKLLAQADKDFTIAFKKDPKLGLIPVLDKENVVSFNGGPELIQHIKDSAIELLQDNDTQAAIEILTPLQDEIVINTQYVPAYLYPVAVKKAIKELKADKKDLAFATVVTALESSQLDTITIPIPLVTAENMVFEASKLEKSHKKEALVSLKMARLELEKAVLLGYTNSYEQGYKNLDKQIQSIETEIKGKNVVVKMYDNLLKDFHSLQAKHSTSKIANNL